MAWNTQDEEYLREHYGEISASAIGRKIGRTREAVVSKADRMGLISKLKANWNTDRSDILEEKRRNIVLYKFPSRPDCVPMVELMDNQCRWPCGDNFCGRDTEKGKSYCNPHHKKAYRQQT